MLDLIFIATSSGVLAGGSLTAGAFYGFSRKKKANQLMLNQKKNSSLVGSGTDNYCTLEDFGKVFQEYRKKAKFNEDKGARVFAKVVEIFNNSVINNEIKSEIEEYNDKTVTCKYIKPCGRSYEHPYSECPLFPALSYKKVSKNVSMVTITFKNSNVTKTCILIKNKDGSFTDYYEARNEVEEFCSIVQKIKKIKQNYEKYSTEDDSDNYDEEMNATIKSKIAEGENRKREVQRFIEAMAIDSINKEINEKIFEIYNDAMSTTF